MSELVGKIYNAVAELVAFVPAALGAAVVALMRSDKPSLVAGLRVATVSGVTALFAGAGIVGYLSWPLAAALAAAFVAGVMADMLFSQVATRVMQRAAESIGPDARRPK